MEIRVRDFDSGPMNVKSDTLGGRNRRRSSQLLLSVHSPKERSARNWNTQFSVNVVERQFLIVAKKLNCVSKVGVHGSFR
jgi:hypothetical protein